MESVFQGHTATAPSIVKSSVILGKNAIVIFFSFASCAAPGVPGCFCSPHHDQYCSVGEACDDSPGGHGCFTPNQVGCGAEMVFMQKLNKKRLYS